MAWWWPFSKETVEPKQATEVWLNKYDAWLDTLQKALAEFPDHADLEGVTLDERAGRLLDDITDLYTEDTRELVERLVLKGEALRRALKNP